MNKYITQKKLRSLDSKSPKQYWKFINSLKQKSSKSAPSLEEFYNHFKLLNASDTDLNETPSTDDQQADEYLNSKITQEEIFRAIRNLKNGKASGCDSILNEYIKSTSHVFYPFMTYSSIPFWTLAFSPNNGLLDAYTPFTRIERLRK